jgi:hypothetical protein
VGVQEAQIAATVATIYDPDTLFHTVDHSRGPQIDIPDVGKRTSGVTTYGHTCCLRGPSVLAQHIYHRATLAQRCRDLESLTHQVVRQNVTRSVFLPIVSGLHLR